MKRLFELFAFFYIVTIHYLLGQCFIDQYRFVNDPRREYCGNNMSTTSERYLNPKTIYLIELDASPIGSKIFKLDDNYNSKRDDIKKVYDPSSPSSPSRGFWIKKGYRLVIPHGWTIQVSDGCGFYLDGGELFIGGYNQWGTYSNPDTDIHSSLDNCRCWPVNDINPACWGVKITPDYPMTHPYGIVVRSGVLYMYGVTINDIHNLTFELTPNSEEQDFCKRHDDMSGGTITVFNENLSLYEPEKWPEVWIECTKIKSFPGSGNITSRGIVLQGIAGSKSFIVNSEISNSNDCILMQGPYLRTSFAYGYFIMPTIYRCKLTPVSYPSHGIDLKWCAQAMVNDVFIENAYIGIKVAEKKHVCSTTGQSLALHLVRDL